MATFNGSNGNNTINGTNGDDTINGNGGNDNLDGRGGHDTVNGGTGNDHIEGGTGNDTLNGDADNDEIYGESGNDILNGGTGHDYLDGGDNDDTLDGGSGNDVLLGGNGNDHLTGGGGLDFIDGGSGFDTAYYSGSILEYDIYSLLGVLAVVHDDGNGADGADLLVRIERLVFADAVINVGVNNAPIAFDDSASTNEDVGTYSSGSASVLDNDFDFEGDALSVTPGSFAGTYGTLNLNADGTYTYTPFASTQALAQGESVQDSFSYTVSDGSLTDTGTLTITIAGVNDAPVANPDAASAGENQTILVDVLANDDDVDNGAVLTVTAASAPAGQGTATVVGNQVQFDPGSDFDELAVGETEVVVVSYTIQDEFGASSSSTINITVTGANDGPVANPDSASAGENQTILVDVLANDDDVDNGAVLTVTAASAPAGQGTASVVGNQVEFDPGTDFDDLADGETEIVVVNYTIEDEHGASSSSTITITVTGTNDGPVANPDTASAGENQTILVDVLANDDDVDNGAVLTVTAASAPAGQGTASVVGNQVQFDPGTDFDDLNVGETEVVVVNYTIEDEHGASSSSTITITVTGANDGPVANPDTDSTGENSIVTVDVLANDTDVDNGAVLTVTAASAPAGQGTATVVGNQVQFDPGADFDDLAVGESEVVVVNYTIEDEHGASSSSTLTITVNGVNDAPTIDGGGTDASGSVTELPNNDPNENAFTHTDSGTIAFDDADVSDTHSASFTPEGVGYVGTFTLDPVNQAGDTVGWDFSVEDSDIDFLDEGETLVQTYEVEISDGNGGFVTQDVTITITGEGDNLPPDAVDDEYDATGNVTLTVNAANGVLANDTDDAGVGTGPGETPVTAFDATSANGGTVSMNPDGSFSYTSAPGFTGTDSFNYTITDAEGEDDTATVTINVENSVWFIDNSAVGSANLGTQADPYTSIASFNAAQGTPNGPAAGETVYLREGLGTYTEADGVNLLDGQILIGGGQDLIVDGDLVESGTGRPTIVTTGAGNHGVELAQNNEVSGFDVGATTGAGISDGGGTVGNLTISDVGVSGAGQIVDIDQGGTLDVTLNGAASTGSTGGAIDLAGVSGSFAVSGATNIAGLHTGGGVDVTGSSATVSFAGGGLVSTGTATGVNFTGNSGSLSITGGGFDIVTTTARALNVETGGSVSISGSGNNIASTTGSAVVIRNASSNGVTLESVSSTGGNDAGIILDNAGTGGFTVTGLASVAGSGGTISAKNGADGSLVQGIGVAITNTDNVSLSNMAITGTQNYGIRGTNVDGFTLRDSSVTGTHGTSLTLGESSIRFTDLTGTAVIEGNTISGGRSENLSIENVGGTLDLSIADSVDDAAVFGQNNLNGNDSVLVETTGAATLTLNIDGVEFQGSRGDLLEVSALGNSTHDIEIHDSTFDNAHANIVSGGGGVLLAGDDDVNVDYLVEGSSFSGASGHALGASYLIASGTVQGRIEGNVIGNNDGIAGVEGSSGGGSGIHVRLEHTTGTGDATYAVAIVDNSIYDIAQGISAIDIQASSDNGAFDVVMEADVDGNVVDEMGDFVFAALYASVGGAAGSGDFSQLGLDITDNVFDLGDADFGGNAIFLNQFSSDSRYYFPGYAGSPNGEFNGGTASVDLDAFLTGQGNSFVNGAFPGQPGIGVDASFAFNISGDPLVLAPWMP